MTNDRQADGVERTRVGHCKRDETDVYAGRGSGDRHLLNTEVGNRGWLGNPYTVEQHGREGCIQMFRSVFEERLNDDPDFRAAVRDLAGQTLGCWCQRLDEDSPACHAEVIAEHADRLASEDDELRADGSGEPVDDVERSVPVDEDLEEAVVWVERELREARRALWDGKSGKAFSAIEAAQDEFETIEEAISDE